MAADRPTVEPTEHRAGTTLKFDRTLPDFPADTWTLTYKLRSTLNAPINFSASANNQDHRVEVAYGTTVDWNAGEYLMIGYVESDTERHEVYRGRITIHAYAADEGTYEWRSFAERMVEKLETAINERVQRIDVSYSINGRSHTLTSTQEMLDALGYFKSIVNQEKNKGKNRKILAKFVKPR